MKITQLVENARCKFTIAIEGPDAVGKHTQAGLLAARLKKRGLSVAVVEMPTNDGDASRKICEILRGDRNVHPVLLQSLFVMDRLIFQTSQLPKMIVEYDVIIFDRWNGSTYAYGRATGVAHDDLVQMLELIAEPDVTLLFDGRSHSSEHSDKFEADDKIQRDVLGFYDEWARLSRGKTYVIDASDTRDAVHESVHDIVDAHLKQIDDSSIPDNVIDLMPHLEIRNQIKELMSTLTNGEDDGPQTA